MQMSAVALCMLQQGEFCSGQGPIMCAMLQVKLCRRILRALASNSQPQQQEREAVTLLKASLDPPSLLSGVPSSGRLFAQLFFPLA